MKDYLKPLLLSLLAVFAPIKSIMLAAGALILLDLATGVWAARKRKETITSARLRDTVTKMVVFQVAVISAFLLEKYLFDNSFPVTKIVAGIIGVVEGTSVFENLQTIYGKPVFSEILTKLGSKNKQ